MHMVNSAWRAHAFDVCEHVCIALYKSLILEMEILVAYLRCMYYMLYVLANKIHIKKQHSPFQTLHLCSHGGLRPWSIVGESCPGETEHVGAEEAHICPSPFCQVGQ